MVERALIGNPALRPQGLRDDEHHLAAQMATANSSSGASQSDGLRTGHRAGGTSGLCRRSGREGRGEITKAQSARVQNLTNIWFAHVTSNSSDASAGTLCGARRRCEQRPQSPDAPTFPSARQRSTGADRGEPRYQPIGSVSDASCTGSHHAFASTLILRLLNPTVANAEPSSWAAQGQSCHMQ